MPWIDLSHFYFEGMPPVKFDPNAKMELKTLKEVDEVNAPSRPNVQSFTCYSHQGSHVDAPKHMFRAGLPIDQLPLEKFIGPAVVWDMPKEEAAIITAADFAAATPTVEAGDIIVLATGLEDRYDSDAFYNNPYFDMSAADWLIEHKIKAVACDMLSVDMPPFVRPQDFNFPIHRRLLGNDVLIFENLCNLKPILGKRVTLIAAPLKIKGADGSPARIIAHYEE